MVHHDWIAQVCKWMGVPDTVYSVLEPLMLLWNTGLEVFVDGRKKVGKWISILGELFQGDSHLQKERQNLLGFA